MTPVAMTFFFIGSIVLYGGLITTLTITIKTKYKDLEDGEDCYEEFTTSKNKSGIAPSKYK